MEQNRRDQRSYDQDNWNRGSDTYNRENDRMDSGSYGNYDRNRDRDYMNNPSRKYGDYNRDYDANQSRDYGRSDMYGSNMGDYDRGMRSGGSYNSGYDRSGENINEYGFGGYANYGNRNYGRGASPGYGNYDEYDRWSKREYGDNRNYGNMHDYRSSRRGDWDRNRHMEHDRDWWDRTKDEVSSWFGDDDAERRRQMDRNRGHRGRGPKNYQRSEERIREDVCDRLSDDYVVDASDVDIQVKGSEVILSGMVDSREAKRRAEDIAESVSGVTNVQNQLRVHHPGSTASYDRNKTMGSTTGTTGTTNR